MGFNVSPELRAEIAGILKESETLSKDSTMKDFSLLGKRVRDLCERAEFLRLSVEVDTTPIISLAETISRLEKNWKSSTEAVDTSRMLEQNRRMRSVFAEVLDTRTLVPTPDTMKAFKDSIKRDNMAEIAKFIGAYKINFTEALMDACRYGTPQSVSFFIRSGGDPSHPKVAQGLLNALLVEGRPITEVEELVRILAPSGLNLNQRMGDDGRYPLQSYVYLLNVGVGLKAGVGAITSLQHAINNWGLNVNPDPTAAESVYITTLARNNFAGAKGARIPEIIEFVRLLLFNGARVSEETAKKLQADPRYSEMYQIRQEALARLQGEMSEDTLRGLQQSAVKETPGDLLRIVGAYTPDTLATISGIPELRQRFYTLCNEIQGKRLDEASKKSGG